MKLTTLFLMAAFMQVYATGFAQKVSITGKDLTLKQVFTAIEKQTDYVVIYNKTLEPDIRKITLSAKEIAVPELLNIVLKDQHIKFVIRGKTIFLSANNQASQTSFPNNFPIYLNVPPVRIKVVDTTGFPLAGASVKIRKNGRSGVTDVDGAISLDLVAGDVITVSFVGYENMDLTIGESAIAAAGSAQSTSLTIVLKSAVSKLQEVEVTVNTGFQKLPKDHATGSFVLLDNATLNRRIGSNILDRLDGVTSGLTFNKNVVGSYGNGGLSIRGRSTIFANESPLIILDNFPYEGDIANINPNDIFSVTVLKDAAAASIWGVKAGNGVIVITTNKGKATQKPTVSINANLTVGEKPDLFYQPQLSSNQWIDHEIFLYNAGRYWQVADGYSGISPVLEILENKKYNRISAADSAKAIDGLRQNDVRNDLDKYIYRKTVNQQYAVNVSGGGLNNKYYTSVGYDKNLGDRVSMSYERLTLNANNSYSFLNNKVEWSNAITFTSSKNLYNNNLYLLPNSPYLRLADEQGAALPVGIDFRKSFTDTAGAGLLLNWRYFPLDELEPTQNTRLTDYRVSTGLSVQLLKALKLTGHFLYQKGVSDYTKTNAQESYFTRSMINQFSIINYANNTINRPVPEGEIVDKSISTSSMATGRLQLDFQKRFNNQHELNMLAGMEIRESKFTDEAKRWYGYDPATGGTGNSAMDFSQLYKYSYGFSNGRILEGTKNSWRVDRNRSYYANVSYSLLMKYILTASARWDESNLFGVKTNQKGVPLWSTGLLWNIHQESFYRSELLPLLRARITYGYNGNVDKSTTALLTARAMTGAVNPFNQPYMNISNPPNPSLRWEKVGVTNLGIDFGFKNQIASGSVEYFIRKSTDLLANNPAAPQLGFDKLKSNSADMRTEGVDLTLNLKMLKRTLTWDAKVLLNYVKDKVTSYKVKQSDNLSIVTGNYLNPLEGYSFYALFSFPYAGLNNNGDPVGYLDGIESTDYTKIRTSTDPKNLEYNGTMVPVYFGSIINNFQYRNFSLSFNIIYKLGYYFRRNSLSGSLLNANVFRQADYDLRWQKPGDENWTNVPALIYPENDSRDVLYTYSSSLAERGDHIRLQDIRLAYSTGKHQIAQLPFSKIDIYMYANNLGILWRRNRHGLDPDAASYPATRSIAIGIKADL